MREITPIKDRKSEILDQAMRLFTIKGYDKTSVFDIMEAVGIAKGTLYYHFKSKEDILNGIIDRIFVTTIGKAQKIVDDEQLNAHEKLLQTLLALQVKEEDTMSVIEEAHKPQNALMYQKMLFRMITELTPLLAGIIEEGNAQGVFHTEYPYESAELFMTYGNVIFDNGFMELTNEAYMTKIAAFIANMERVLGVEQGSMQYVLQKFQ